MLNLIYRRLYRGPEVGVRGGRVSDWRQQSDPAPHVCQARVSPAGRDERWGTHWCWFVTVVHCTEGSFYNEKTTTTTVYIKCFLFAVILVILVICCVIFIFLPYCLGAFKLDSVCFSLQPLVLKISFSYIITKLCVVDLSYFFQALIFYNLIL